MSFIQFGDIAIEVGLWEAIEEETNIENASSFQFAILLTSSMNMKQKINPTA